MSGSGSGGVFFLDSTGSGSGTGAHIPNWSLAVPIFLNDAIHSTTEDGDGRYPDDSIPGYGALQMEGSGSGKDCPPQVKSIDFLYATKAPCGYKIDISLVGASLPLPDGSGHVTIPTTSLTVQCGVRGAFGNGNFPLLGSGSGEIPGGSGDTNGNPNCLFFIGSAILKDGFGTGSGSGSGSGSGPKNDLLFYVYLTMFWVGNNPSPSGSGPITLIQFGWAYVLSVFYQAMPNANGYNIPATLPDQMVPFAYNWRGGLNNPVEEPQIYGPMACLFQNIFHCYGCTPYSGSGFDNGFYGPIDLATLDVTGIDYTNRYGPEGAFTNTQHFQALSTQIYPYISEMVLTPQFGVCSTNGSTGSGTKCVTCTLVPVVGVGGTGSGTGTGSGPCPTCIDPPPDGVTSITIIISGGAAIGHSGLDGSHELPYDPDGETCKFSGTWDADDGSGETSYAAFVQCDTDGNYTAVVGAEDFDGVIPLGQSTVCCCPHNLSGSSTGGTFGSGQISVSTTGCEVA